MGKCMPVWDPEKMNENQKLLGARVHSIFFFQSELLLGIQYDNTFQIVVEQSSSK